MPRVLDPFRFVLIAVAGWMNQRQLQIIDYLREESQVLREQLGGRRLRLNDDQRRRLAAKAKGLGRELRVQLHHRTHQRVQPIEAPPHITRRCRQVYAHACRQMNHRGSRNTLSTKGSVPASIPSVMWTRSPEVRMISTASAHTPAP
jgi:hypothetical protein